MATMTPKLPEDLMKKLSRLENKTDEICEHALQSGAKVVESAVASNLDAVVGKGTKYESRSTGQLQAALGTSPVKQGKDGTLNIKIGFAEPRKDGTSNAKIANILEYGKAGQNPTNFLKRSKTASKKPATEAMKDILEKEMNGI